MFMMLKAEILRCMFSEGFGRKRRRWRAKDNIHTIHTIQNTNYAPPLQGEGHQRHLLLMQSLYVHKDVVSIDKYDEYDDSL